MFPVPYPPELPNIHTLGPQCRACKGPCDMRPRPWLNTNLEAKATLDEPKFESPAARKFDLNLLLQFPEALNAVGEVLEFGQQAKSYPWQHFATLPLDKQRASIMRHLLGTGADHTGLDDESKLFHAVHLASRTLMYLQTLLTTE
ncbi:hypothetical protein JG068_025 [Burkholderia phage JG068]|uniref:dATP/dGTP diphosphohydrolase N-terminal domain-containing protein n=1 Tax=Burkholderia phage JG068 TaxID=1401297 RepID=U3PBA6_9CAUD|nr:hypothetical protein JG068_025 [Burkholderia phage JG068]AGW43607.1 hypothetical protein JG068_025 [Burkholderia phage JG068]